MMQPQGEVLTNPEGNNDYLAGILVQIADQQSTGAGDQPFDEEARTELAEKLEAIYRTYYQQATQGKGPEGLLDSSVATREQYFAKVEQYTTAHALYGISREDIDLPEDVSNKQIEEAANTARKELGSLYGPPWSPMNQTSGVLAGLRAFTTLSPRVIAFQTK
jgi:hypothetical protein